MCDVVSGGYEQVSLGLLGSCFIVIGSMNTSHFLFLRTSSKQNSPATAVSSIFSGLIDQVSLEFPGTPFAAGPLHVPGVTWHRVGLRLGEAAEHWLQELHLPTALGLVHFNLPRAVPALHHSARPLIDRAEQEPGGLLNQAGKRQEESPVDVSLP